MFRNVLIPVAACTLLLTNPAIAATWQEANKASVALMQEGKLQQAFDTAWQAASLYENSPTYKANMHERLLLNAADIFLQMQQPAKAPDIMLQALASLRRHVPDTDVTNIALTEQAARAYGAIGDGARARVMLEQVAALYARNHGAESVGHVNALMELIQTAKSSGDNAGAKTYLDKVDGITASLAESHPFRVMVDYEKALGVMESGRDSAAAAQFRGVIQRAKQTDSAATRNVMRNAYGMLAYIAHREGDPDLEDKMVEATRSLPKPEGDIAPLFRAAPEMPDGGRLSVSGKAVVEFKVSTSDGRVKEVRVLESSGDPRYSTLVSRSVMNWRFQPTSPEGSTGALVTTRHSFNS